MRPRHGQRRRALGDEILILVDQNGLDRRRADIKSEKGGSAHRHFLPLADATLLAASSQRKGPGVAAEARDSRNSAVRRRVSGGAEIARRVLARALVGDDLVGDLLTFSEFAQARALHGADMNENVLAAVVGLD